MCRPPHFFDDPNRFHEQSRPFSSKSCPPPRNGKVLAWAAEGDAIHRLYLVAVNFCDVSKVNHFSAFLLARMAGIEPTCLPLGISQNGRQLPYYTRISKPTAPESSAVGRPDL